MASLNFQNLSLKSVVLLAAAMAPAVNAAGLLRRDPPKALPGCATDADKRFQPGKDHSTRGRGPSAGDPSRRVKQSTNLSWNGLPDTVRTALVDGDFGAAYLNFKDEGGFSSKLKDAKGGKDIPLDVSSDNANSPGTPQC